MYALDLSDAHLWPPMVEQLNTKLQLLLDIRNMGGHGLGFDKDVQNLFCQAVYTTEHQLCS